MNKSLRFCSLLTCVLLAGWACAGGPDGVQFKLAQVPLAVGPMAGLPELADVNGDGNLDVVLACGPCCGAEPSPESGHVQILLGDGTGELSYSDAAIKVGDTALRVAVGDLNGDDHLDIVCIQHSSYEAMVLFGNNSGKYSSDRSTTFPLHTGRQAHVHSVVIADANNDGFNDIMASLINDHAIAVHLGDGKGKFQAAMAQPFFAMLHPYEQLNALDMNADGNIDIVCTDLRGNGITLLLGSGTGMFSPSTGFKLEAHSPIEVSERPISSALGDFDEDGKLDIIAHLDDGKGVVLMLNRGKGTFTPASGMPMSMSAATSSIRVTDIDGDGRLDVVTGSVSSETVSIRLGRGDGSFHAQFALNSNGGDPAVAIGDMNGDGLPDIVTGNYTSGNVSVLLNRGRE